MLESKIAGGWKGVADGELEVTLSWQTCFDRELLTPKELMIVLNSLGQKPSEEVRTSRARSRNALERSTARNAES